MMRSAFFALTLGFLTITLCSASTNAVAQDGPAEAAPEDSRATQFRAMQGPAQESVPGGTLMVAAYGLVWLFVFAYIVRIALLSAKTSSEVERLSSALAKKTLSPENKG
ncbi:MAG: hypothetical protein IPK60_15090 [Sandaracinaceae bacterium]|jgi:CcmD family protein|nr:hypothetical protein [Sandaracinaceae bacterium]